MSRNVYPDRCARCSEGLSRTRAKQFAITASDPRGPMVQEGAAHHPAQHRKSNMSSSSMAPLQPLKVSLALNLIHPGSVARSDLVRDAGTLVPGYLKCGGGGTFTFPHPNFAAEMSSLGYPLTDEKVFRSVKRLARGLCEGQ